MTCSPFLLHKNNTLRTTKALRENKFTPFLRNRLIIAPCLKKSNRQSNLKLVKRQTNHSFLVILAVFLPVFVSFDQFHPIHQHKKKAFRGEDSKRPNMQTHE
jgi:hypothetical protein